MAKSSQMTDGPEPRYAKALFSLAQDKKKLDAVSAEVAVLTETLAGDGGLGVYLTSPVVQNAEKAKTLADMAKKTKMTELTASFLQMVAESGRADLLGGMLRCFGVMAAEAKGEVTAQVTTAKPLTATQQKDLEKFVKAQRKDAKTVVLAETVDASQLAGVKVRIGAQEFDATARGRLQQLKNALRA